MPRLNPPQLCILLAGLLCASLPMAISNGSVDIPTDTLWQLLMNSAPEDGRSAIHARILWELRLPRVLMALLCGAALALCGATLQCLTRNPLADPYLFGISAGASLGAVIALTTSTGAAWLAHSWGFSLAAFVGAMVAVLVIVGMVRDGRTEGLILAGVAISFLFSSLASLVLYFADPQAMQAVLFWTMGSFARASWNGLTWPLITLLLAGTAIISQHRILTALMVGDESAHTQGIAVKPVRLVMLLLTALITASVVAQCGSIGFVGLMVPHMVRRLAGGAGRWLLPCVMLFGALMMLWVDLLSRQLLPNQELPVGVITAILGSLFFLVLLFQRRSAL
ncbi:iron ABC transporter permease [Ferrimonas balearica]|uniref:FecCD family ABC transporter permease n=1 Tax=Ferrimonas balearica TaxID=44012 RepID=UPI001C579EA1|nr:iron ABC transporter permease [Ferrimonas balearica]MBW3141512.1 iron ABC transporter permease [Ferrimonas balearica]